MNKKMSVSPEIQKRVVERIDAQIGNNREKLKSAAELVKEYKKKLSDIRKRFIYEHNKSSVFKIAVDTVKMRGESIEQEIETLDEWLKKLQAEKDKLAFDIIKNIQPNLDEVRKLQNLLNYMEIIETMHEINNKLEIALNEHDHQELANIYLFIYDATDYESNLVGRLRKVDAPYLQKYALNITNHWYTTIKEHLSADLEEILKTMLVSKQDEPMLINYEATPEAVQSAQMLAEYLFLLQSPNIDEEPLVDIGSGFICQPLSEVTKVLLKPYKQRFDYHFTGKRKTNRLDKPEWIYTQILNWGKQVHLFVENTFQETAIKAGETNLNMRLEFLRGLVQLIMEKLSNDMELFMSERTLFAHLVDETLAFEAELRYIFDYPASFPSAISILTQPKFLTKWTAIEEASFEVKLDKVLQYEYAWSVIDPLHPLEDDLKISICVDKFLRMLDAIKQRYFVLIQPGQQLQFLNIQLKLIESFRRRLVQLYNANIITAHSVLNAVNYMIMVLRDWGEDVHYLHLNTTLVGTNSNEINSVFDGPVTDLEDWLSTMLEHYSDHIVNDIKATSVRYCDDDWAHMPEQSNKDSLVLTPSGGEMFRTMLITLHSLHNDLAVNLLNRVTRYIAREIDGLLFENLILCNKFSTGGANQFHFDMTRNLFTLFGQYIRRADLLFKKVNNSIKLLTLARGAALLLHETLLSKNNLEEQSNALQELEINELDTKKCIQVLERRMDVEALPSATDLF